MKGLTGKILKAAVLPVLLLCCLFIAACSGAGDEKTAEEGVDKLTSQAAEAVVNKVQSPIDAARMTKGLGDSHLEEIDQAVQQQE